MEKIKDLEKERWVGKREKGVSVPSWGTVLVRAGRLGSRGWGEEKKTDP